ncbi:MAG: SDR family NAD(P)-dependent oxidoreductase, partial [Pseudomonadota bacterium]
MSNMFDLSGKVAIVTGANTGLGQGIALALAEAGASISLVGRSAPDETVSKIEALGGRSLSIQADLSELAPVKDIIDRTREELGGADI